MSATATHPDSTSLLDEISSLKSQLEKQNKLIESKNKKLSQKDALINVLYEKLKLQRHRQFGRKSEKEISDDPQARLFDEAELPPNETERADEEETMTIPAHQRTKQSSKGRKPLPEHLPRIRREYAIPDSEKICPCGCQLTCIGETVSEQLDYIPAKIQVIQHARKKYACKACEEKLVEAKLPPLPIPKSIATSGLLAYVCVSKFEDYLPLYRQERLFQRIGVDLPRASLSNWVIRCGDLLLPLYKLLQARLSDYDIGSADETEVQVLREPNRSAAQKSYM